MSVERRPQMCRSGHRIALAFLVWFCGLSLAAPPASAQDPAPLRLLRVTPSGEDVPPGRQIVFQFDRGAVPVGRMERTASEIPITISPDPGCEWRWLDTSALACRLGEDNPLVPSTRYRITIGTGSIAADGAGLDRAQHHGFVTQRPRPIHWWFQTWKSPGTPLLRVTFDQPVTWRSAERRLVFEMEDGERIPVTLSPVDGSETAWTVAPVRELPLDRRIEFAVEPGILSRHGTEGSVEDRPVVVFRTFPEFRFLGIACRDNADEPVRIEPGQFQDRGCDPLGTVHLVFSSPVVKEVLREGLRVSPDLAGGRDDHDPWEQVWSHSRLTAPPRIHEYRIPLPGVLQADAAYRLRAKVRMIRDEFDRPLDRPIDFDFRTDHRRPKLHVGHPVSVLESGVESHLPIVATNLDRLHVRFDTLEPGGRMKPGERSIELPRVTDVAYRHPLRVHDWLGGRSGAMVGRIRSEPATSHPPEWFFSQVTPFQVHVKVGYYNTLVWVTDLATGRPVEGARVKVIRRVWRTLREEDGETLSDGVTDASGVVVLDGSETLDPDGTQLSFWHDLSQRHLFVHVEHDGALALLPLAREFHVDTSGSGSWMPTLLETRHGHFRAWGATAQGVYRAGETIQYKIYLRREGNQTLQAAPRGTYRLEVRDPLGKTVHERDEIELSEFGAFHGELRVPETGAVGWYLFEILADFAGQRRWQPLRVLVTDFTPAPFRVTSDLNGELFLDGDLVVVSSTATLHSGGPYVDAQTRVSAVLRPAPFRARVDGFRFETGYAEEETIHSSEAALDERGEQTTRFEVRSGKILFGTLDVESAVRDDRGKNVAGRGTARFAARDRFVGIRQEDWVLRSGEPAEVLALVADQLGNPTAGTAIEFVVERRKTEAARVKGAGNAYLTHYVHTWVEQAGCTRDSAVEAVSCRFTPDGAGFYRITVSIEDTRGRPTKSTLFRWAAGKGVVLWEQPPGHQLQISPEKESLRVGETARYLIKNPYPGAQALITLERFGVLKQWIETLADSTAIIEFPVEPDFIPGFYLSVVVTSPRVEAAPATDRVDLGKPGFRQGYVRVPVRDGYKELQVDVLPGAEVYKPGDRVAVDIRARTLQGGLPAIELAVAVLDESVLDLLAARARTFDPYLGFYDLQPLDLRNYNLLARLIGMQKFEKKGANPGGGGGGDPAMRSNFKFVSYWNPSVRPDERGRARVEFDLPDNLTGWRVLVMAVTPTDRMGLGQASFRVNRPTEIRPALPNQLIEGDRFDARFTVINRTDRTRTLEVTGSARGAAVNTVPLTRTIDAQPYKRYVVAMPVTAGDPGEIELSIRAGDRLDTDGLKLTVPVRRREALHAAATYGTTTAGEAGENVLFPEEIRTDTGRVSVVTSPTVIGALDGAFRYMRDYPHICWEQVLTRGVMAAHYLQLRDYLSDDLVWSEADGLTVETLERAASYQTPSGAMAYYVPRDLYASPYLSAYTALAFQWLREMGYAIPPAVENRLHDYLLRLLRRDVFPDFYSKGMASSVRAVALAALAGSGKIGPADLDRYRRHVPQMDLFGKAHFLQALNRFEETASLRDEVRDAILAHADQSGGKIAFTEQLDDGYTRILHSTLRTSCSILAALVQQDDATLAAAGTGSLPFKLVRAITQTRKQRERWENTQENMFCTNALVEYSSRYERESPDFAVKVSLDSERLGAARFDDVRDEPVELERAIRADDPGRAARVRIEREGRGRLYYSVRLFYSPSDLVARRVNAGIEVRREYHVERGGVWIRLERPARVRQGEIVRVDLYVTIPAPRNFVALSDPVPGGLEPVNRDLATASTVDADKAHDVFPPDSHYFQYDDWRSYSYTRWSFYHRELRHDSARFYSEYLPAGRYHLSYVTQVVAPGEFSILPARADEMYDPDVFSLGLPSTLVVSGSGE